MDTARTERGGLPRLLSRALLVLGGAVVATVAGWLLSTASASAATLPGLPADPVPVVHPATQALAHTVTGAVESVAKARTAPLPHGVGTVGGALSGAIDRLDPHVPAKPVPVPAPVRVVPAVAPAPHVAPVHHAPSAHHVVTHRTPRPQPHRPAHVVRSVHIARTVPPTAPGLPAPAPWSPVTVPAAPSSGGAGAAGSGGGLGFAEQSGVVPVPALHVVRIVPLPAAPGLDTTGRRPGSTPD